MKKLFILLFAAALLTSCSIYQTELNGEWEYFDYSTSGTVNERSIYEVWTFENGYCTFWHDYSSYYTYSGWTFNTTYIEYWYDCDGATLQLTEVYGGEKSSLPYTLDGSVLTIDGREFTKK